MQSTKLLEPGPEQVLTPNKRNESEISPKTNRAKNSIAKKPSEVPLLPIEKLNQVTAEKLSNG